MSFSILLSLSSAGVYAGAFFFTGDFVDCLLINTFVFYLTGVLEVVATTYGLWGTGDFLVTVGVALG